MDNMHYWNQLKTPPKEALKKITGGRLSGMSDVNPQWRYRVMTEVFGMCGFGWKYRVVGYEIYPAPEEQVVLKAEIEVSYKVDGEWSEPIPGVGGSMLVERERAGLHVNDEAYKMATTDALSVALKMIGVAADVYAGMMDGTKYRDTSAEERAHSTPARDLRDLVPQSTESRPVATAQATKEHWCSLHSVRFFMAGRMKSHAHPIRDDAGSDTGEWCYERSQPTEASPATPSGFATSKQRTDIVSLVTRKGYDIAVVGKHCRIEYGATHLEGLTVDQASAVINLLETSGKLTTEEKK